MNVSKYSLFVKSNKAIVIICALNLIVHGIGITWGLPNFDSWAVDSVVPTGVLKGLSKGFSFGYVYIYPIVHLLLLGILIIPILLVAAVHALVLHSPSQIFEIIALAKKASAQEQWSIIQTLLPIKYYTTSIIMVGNSVSLIMSVGVVYLVYRIAKELFNEEAGLFSAALLTFNASFNYYSHTSNVDVPYLFWGLFALYQLVLIIKYNRKENYFRCAVFAVLCFGTKDQGYALFVLPFLIYLVILPLWNRRRNIDVYFSRMKNMIGFTIIFIIGFVVVENLVLNYNGFISRIKIMTGENSAGYTKYLPSIAGYSILIKDLILVYCNTILSWPIALTALIGLIIALVKERKRIVAIILPFVSALSFVLFFVLVIRRSDHRFLLAPSVLMAIYAGYMLGFLYNRFNKKVLHVIYAFVSVYLFVFTFNININMFMDVRYKATKWMQNHIPAGSTVEHYEDYVYLPQFPSQIKEYRIKKNFDAIASRNPDYIIISSKWYKRFLSDTDVADRAGVKTPDRVTKFKESEQGAFIRSLLAGEKNYQKKISFTHSVPWPFSFAPITIPEKIVILEKN